jgi:hypothetical protein
MDCKQIPNLSSYSHYTSFLPLLGYSLRDVHRNILQDHCLYIHK